MYDCGGRECAGYWLADVKTLNARILPRNFSNFRAKIFPEIVSNVAGISGGSVSRHLWSRDWAEAIWGRSNMRCAGTLVLIWESGFQGIFFLNEIVQDACRLYNGNHFGWRQLEPPLVYSPTHRQQAEYIFGHASCPGKTVIVNLLIPRQFWSSGVGPHDVSFQWERFVSDDNMGKFTVLWGAR